MTQESRSCGLEEVNGILALDVIAAEICIHWLKCCTLARKADQRLVLYVPVLL